MIELPDLSCAQPDVSMCPTQLNLPDVAAASVDLWLVRWGGFDAGQCAWLRSLLSADELLRNQRFSHPGLRRRDAVSRGLLRLVVAQSLHVAPSELQLGEGEHGKPRIAGRTGPYFNYSHAGDYLAIAVCDTAEVGVDIEVPERQGNFLRIAKKRFRDYEYDAIAEVPAAQQEELFLRYWTHKEALLKAQGEGIFSGLDHFGFRFSVQSPAQTELRFHEGAESSAEESAEESAADESRRWQFYCASSLAACQLALAVEAGEQCFDVNWRDPFALEVASLS